ncbi:MAG: alpha/beta fold hydrolase [Saprospiraceae bacterium]|nr:alpha/beta fold hydrolase [Saprospiraceae bacterium]
MKEQSAIPLHFKKAGNGPVLIILHGLFGSLDNWQSFSKTLSEKFTVYTLDLRNHGKSPHTDSFSYPLMALDVIQFLEGNQLNRVYLLGHSMGGKVVLEMLHQAAPQIEKAIILDIAPKSYPRGHDSVFDAMFSLNLELTKTRIEADLKIMEYIPEFAVRQFILKNLDRDKEGNFFWKPNLKALYENYSEINKEINFKHPIQKDVLFVKGSLSPYLNTQDERTIIEFLPHAQFKEVEGAGHWIHADKPLELLEIVNLYFA